MLKYVKTDIRKDLNYVDLVGFQMDVTPALEEAIQSGRIPNNTDLVDWKMAWDSPTKYKGFFGTFFEGLFLGKNKSELNIDYQLDSQQLLNPSRRVCMLWGPYTTKRDNVKKVANIAKEYIGGSYHIITLTGEFTNNKKAEKYVEQELKKTDKPVLIISCVLATRSFSVGDIYEVYLAYDRGNNGSNTQKVSRALTTDSENLSKKAIIVSLSFDPNRDDKFDSYIIEAAIRLSKRNGKSINENLNIVSNAFNIFSCTNNGAIRLLNNDFVTKSLEKGSASKVFAHKVDLTNMSIDEKIQFSNGLSSLLKTKENKIETKLSKSEKNKLIKSFRSQSNKKDLDAIVREALFNFIENSKFIVGAGRDLGAIGILDCFEKFENYKYSKSLIDDISNFYEIDYSLIKKCIVNGWIKAEWIDFVNNKLISK